MSADPSHFGLGVGGARAVGMLDQPCLGVGLGGAHARPCVGGVGPSGGGEGHNDSVEALDRCLYFSKITSIQIMCVPVTVATHLVARQLILLVVCQVGESHLISRIAHSHVAMFSALPLMPAVACHPG